MSTITSTIKDCDRATVERLFRAINDSFGLNEQTQPGDTSHQMPKDPFSTALEITACYDFDEPVWELPKNKVNKPYFRQKERW